MWSLPYFASKCGDAEVTVALTPDGRADAVKPVTEANGARLFVKPYERRVKMRDFCAALGSRGSPETEAAGIVGVPYLSRQNDSLRDEFSGTLADDVPVGGPAFAASALGGAAEAVNLWVGDERSVTSTHQVREKTRSSAW